jgi:hypothetical protein
MKLRCKTKQNKSHIIVSYLVPKFRYTPNRQFNTGLTIVLNKCNLTFYKMDCYP